MTWSRHGVVQRWRCPYVTRGGGDLDQVEDDNHMTHRDGVLDLAMSEDMPDVDGGGCGWQQPQASGFCLIF